MSIILFQCNNNNNNNNSQHLQSPHTAEDDPGASSATVLLKFNLTMNKGCYNYKKKSLKLSITLCHSQLHRFTHITFITHLA